MQSTLLRSLEFSIDTVYVPVSHGRDSPLQSMLVLVSLWAPEDNVSGGQQTMGWVVGEVVLHSAAHTTHTHITHHHRSKYVHTCT